MNLSEFLEIKIIKIGFISRGTRAVLTRRKLRRSGARAVGIVVRLWCITWLHHSRSSPLREMDGPDIEREFFYKSMFSLTKM